MSDAVDPLAELISERGRDIKPTQIPASMLVGGLLGYASFRFVVVPIDCRRADDFLLCTMLAGVLLLAAVIYRISKKLSVT